MEVIDLIDFELPSEESSIIKVIGVGGGGGNAVNHMYREGIKDVTFVICNTDNQALKKSPIKNKIQLGPVTTAGLGAGNNPDRAREAAEESIDEIRSVLSRNTKMAFITAGMGGGTGTGAAPVIAKIAKELDILTVGIVTIPFAFEGPRKISQALEGVRLMNECVDALLVINNERLRDIYPELDLSNAFAKADDVLKDAAKGIAEIITIHGHINLDFADVNAIMRNGGVAIMNSGYASGENRLRKAIDNAIASPLLKNNNIVGAKKILMNFYCRQDETSIKMDEITQINEFMEMVGDQAEVIWGISFDNDLEEEVKITLIATGFDVSDIAVPMQRAPIVLTPTPKEEEAEPQQEILLDDEESSDDMSSIFDQEQPESRDAMPCVSNEEQPESRDAMPCVSNEEEPESRDDRSSVSEDEITEEQEVVSFKEDDDENEESTIQLDLEEEEIEPLDPPEYKVVLPEPELDPLPVFQAPIEESVKPVIDDLFDKYYGDTKIEQKKKAESFATMSQQIDDEKVVDELESIPAYKRRQGDEGPKPFNLR
jgi:cell division protein FtsZ